MIAIVVICAVLLQSPTSLDHAPSAQVTHQASEDIAMPAYQVEQIIWWNFYGEWATGGNAGEVEASAAKQDVTPGNEAAQKTSAK